MDTSPNPSNWSKLPLDILISLFGLLSFVDFHRTKVVCSTWYSASKQTVPRKSGSPLLTLLLDDGRYVLYNQDEDVVYKIERDFSRSRFLACCGKWFLMLDSQSRLYIIDVFSENRIDLPPLESLLSSSSSLKRVEDRDREFIWELTDGTVLDLFADEIRGRLWVNEKAKELALVWFFDAPAAFLCFYKKGNKHYDFIPVKVEIPKLLTGLYGLVLRGYCLHILTARGFVRVLDFSGQQGFEERTDPTPTFACLGVGCEFSMAVTTGGEVLLVTTTRSETSFRVYKKDPDTDLDDFTPDLLEVDSLGNEALLLDLGITVPANYTLGIKPNCIYFTRHDKLRLGSRDRSHVLPPYEVDIRVFNLATKTLEPIPYLSNMNLKDARWLFPMN